MTNKHIRDNMSLITRGGDVGEKKEIYEEANIKFINRYDADTFFSVLVYTGYSSLRS